MIDWPVFLFSMPIGGAAAWLLLRTTWCKWNVYCLRGRRCARLHIGVDGTNGEIPEDFQFEHVRYGWTCAACGSEYEAEAIIYRDGSVSEVGMTRK